MNLRPKAANGNRLEAVSSARNSRLLEWLSRLTQPGFTLDMFYEGLDSNHTTAPLPPGDTPQNDDWIAVFHICGYDRRDFADAAAPLPLTAAEIDHFRRNHRGTENHISRDFLMAQTDLPSPLAELYGLYLHRTRIDIESTLFLAQSTTSTRVARAMADLVAAGAFANGLEYVSHLGVSHAVSAAFDTAISIDRANSEAIRRLALPAHHPSHLLTLTPDELGVLASSITEKTILEPEEFFEKSNLLAEARQDVTRLPAHQHFATAVTAQDIPLQANWGMRLAMAYARILPRWVADISEIQSILN